MAIKEFVFFTIRSDTRLSKLIQKSKLHHFFYLKKDLDGIGIEYYFSAHTALCLRSKSKNLKLIEALSHAVESKCSGEELHLIDSKIKIGFKASLQDSPNYRTKHEIYLFMKSRPWLSVEYVGRNVSAVEAIRSPEHPSVPEQTFVLDIAGRDRRYYWKTHSLEYTLGEPTAQLRLPCIKQWFEDPDSRVVLSLGGGGFRMYGIPTLLKIIDQLGARDSIHEVWGCSGGALVGYTYSLGVAPEAIEAGGYDFYLNKYPDFALQGLRPSLIYNIIKSKIFNRGRGGVGTGIIDVEKVFRRAADRLIKKRDPLARQIPCYSIATRHEDKKTFVLTEPHLIPPYMEDVMIGTDGMSATIASSSIPLLFSPMNIKDARGKNHLLVDGMIGEELPVFHPFLKWKRDRIHKPDETPKKLKIFYIDLRCRSSEIEFIQKLEKKVSSESKLLVTSRLLDMVLDNRIYHHIQTLSLMPDVEVIGIQLKLGRLAALDTDLIPFVIQCSRERVLAELDSLNQHLKEATSRGSVELQL